MKPLPASLATISLTILKSTESCVLKPTRSERVWMLHDLPLISLSSLGFSFMVLDQTGNSLLLPGKPTPSTFNTLIQACFTKPFLDDRNLIIGHVGQVFLLSSSPLLCWSLLPLPYHRMICDMVPGWCSGSGNWINPQI